ncbi:hypothetical protein HBH98_054450 [Parastagonospora nodorum]|nr:hypothetical protein HBH49_056830 [Parastagonospora nodorum]KAH4071677.1 hypothetical protein HBH50_067180 [Parastagonospora nodorum]KAH4083201.1 hypothetical protein HBH46_218040 [Parastagonospora nodorum]KAH4312363.1 hypothetical protein HBI02_084000 [Parastagonospora nodorum]KAH4320093.1 hypothetical protein HBI00_232600 [Parastagonospora nodorum]
MPKMPYYTFPAILSLNQPFRGLVQEIAFGAGQDNLIRYSPSQSPVTSYQGDHLFGIQKQKLKNFPISTMSLSLGDCTFIEIT